jgi:hypothetical protein
MLAWMYFTVVLGELVSRDPSNWHTWFLEVIALLMAIFCAVMMFRSRTSWRPAAEVSRLPRPEGARRAGPCQGRPPLSA